MRTARMLAIVLVALGFGIVVDACDDQRPAVESSTTTEAPTTTTLKPITTLADLVGDKTIEDVKNSARGMFDTGDPVENGDYMDVPSALNVQYTQVQSGSIWYIGPYNRGDPESLGDNELNNSLVTYEGVGSNIFCGFGNIQCWIGNTTFENFDPKTDGYVEIFAFVFKDIVPIPESNDFYLHGTVPYNNDADIYARVVRDGGKHPETYLKCFNVNSKVKFDPYSSKYSRKAGALTDEEWAIFLVPGDTIGMLTQFHPSPGYDVYYDENEKPILKMFANIRSLGADKMEAVLGVGQ